MFNNLAKAFDSLDRGILLKKLEFYGVRGQALKWFKSYFSKRQPYVGHGDSKYPLVPVDYSVPHGSMLDPFLFLTFNNDIV